MPAGYIDVTFTSPGTAGVAQAISLSGTNLDTGGQDVTVTFNDSGAGGTFNPTSVLLSDLTGSNPTAETEYTPAGAGTVTFNFAEDSEDVLGFSYAPATLVVEAQESGSMPIDNDEVIIAHGKHIAYSDVIETPSYTTVAGTVDVNLPERELGATEITNDDSPDFHKEYVPGMFEPGTTTFTYRYTKTTFAAIETIFQLASAAATRGEGAGKATKLWKVTLPDGSTATVKGFITAHNLPVEGAEDSPVVEVQIQNVGKVAYAAAA